MVERVVERGREPEPEETTSAVVFRWLTDMEEKLRNGRVVIHGKEIRWEQNRQALIHPYVNPANWDKYGTPPWMVFVQYLKKHSGKHKHQGGFGIYVLEGKGYTVVDGERFDWEKDDLIILPVKPGGCEHQHFNSDPNVAAQWLAIWFAPFRMATGNEQRQKETSPTYDGAEKFMPDPTGHVA
ncbi:MAG: cupin domain-containing protein [Chloroflexi bacterium]|nr:cupin domain-containing protein [Chloroflexota bacterium]